MSRLGEIRLSGFLICDEDDIATVLDALPHHVELTLAEPGCLHFEVIQSSSNPCRFAVFERFVDRAAFEAHQTRTRSSEWWALTKHIPRDFEISEL